MRTGHLLVSLATALALAATVLPLVDQPVTARVGIYLERVATGGKVAGEGVPASPRQAPSHVVAGEPVRQSVNPVMNAHTAPPANSVSITYDQPMDVATVSKQTFAVHAMQTGLLSQVYAVDGGTISLAPTQTFQAGELVQVSATTGTLNTTGTGPLAPTVWQFRTAVQGGRGVLLPGPGFGSGTDQTWDIALGDVNGDGHLDLVAGNYQAENAVYLNNGDGTFASAGNSFGPSTDRTYQVSLGDVDGDGDLDVAEASGFWTRVYYNDGDGTFDTSTHNVASGNPWTLALGDVDGDGDLDIAVGHYPGQDVVHLNDGDGTFDTTSYNVGPADGETGSVALGDVDGDSDLDLAVGNKQQNTVYLNDGDGTFDTTAHNFGPATGDTRSLALGDLDGDGDLDIALGQANYQNKVCLNDGDGTFDTTTHDFGPSGDETYRLDLGDTDADGDLDLAVGNGADQSVVYLNDGDGTFDTISYNLGPRGDQTVGLALGDVDADGDLDAAVGNFWAQNLIYLNPDVSIYLPLVYKP